MIETKATVVDVNERERWTGHFVNVVAERVRHSLDEDSLASTERPVEKNYLAAR